MKGNIDPQQNKIVEEVIVVELETEGEIHIS
jgi:hypothetical protein